MTDKIIVFSTCGSAEEADKIARGLVERKVAACVNVLPGIRSIYRWKGSVEDAQEFLLVIKTTRELFGRVRDEIRGLHSYEVPEIIAVPVLDGLDAYLDWISESVG
jgi:periplasmic divalent cation tolerance protein